MVRNPIIVMIITFAVVSGAQAARLTEIQGKVLVNKGDGFWEVNGSTAVSVGDRILVRGKGRAQIDYGSGCIKRVLASQTAVVAAKPNCDPAPAVAQQQPAVSKAPTAAKDGPVGAASIQSDPDPALAVVGAAAVATVVAGIASQDESHQGIAPKSEGDEGNVVTGDTVASSSASANREVQSSSILVVDNLVITKSDAASVALEGADNKDGSPASP
jgi:hypothetical protein